MKGRVFESESVDGHRPHHRDRGAAGDRPPVDPPPSLLLPARLRRRDGLARVRVAPHRPAADFSRGPRRPAGSCSSRTVTTSTSGACTRRTTAGTSTSLPAAGPGGCRRRAASARSAWRFRRRADDRLRDGGRRDGHDVALHRRPLVGGAGEVRPGPWRRRPTARDRHDRRAASRWPASTTRSATRSSTPTIPTCSASGAATPTGSTSSAATGAATGWRTPGRGQEGVGRPRDVDAPRGRRGPQRDRHRCLAPRHDRDRRRYRGRAPGHRFSGLAPMRLPRRDGCAWPTRSTPIAACFSSTRPAGRRRPSCRWPRAAPATPATTGTLTTVPTTTAR